MLGEKDAYTHRSLRVTMSDMMIWQILMIPPTMKQFRVHICALVDSTHPLPHLPSL